MKLLIEFILDDTPLSTSRAIEGGLLLCDVLTLSPKLFECDAEELDSPYAVSYFNGLLQGLRASCVRSLTDDLTLQEFLLYGATIKPDTPAECVIGALRATLSYFDDPQVAIAVAAGPQVQNFQWWKELLHAQRVNTLIRLFQEYDNGRLSSSVRKPPGQD